MTGLTRFSIEESEFFKRSLKKLVKSTGKGLEKKLIRLLSNILEDLLENPYPINSKYEPLPRKTQLVDDWTFHKLKFRLTEGASGQIRLMYLVSERVKIVKPVWIYSHKQFSKRPKDKDIGNSIDEILGI